MIYSLKKKPGMRTMYIIQNDRSEPIQQHCKYGMYTPVYRLKDAKVKLKKYQHLKQVYV